MSVADSCLGPHSDATFARENLIVHDPRGMVHPLNAFRHPRSYARRRAFAALVFAGVRIMTSSFVAASSCIVGTTWEYVSSVIPICE